MKNWLNVLKTKPVLKSIVGNEGMCVVMSFYEYMISRHRYKKSRAGDLAKDMERDNKLDGFFSNLNECSLEHQYKSIEAHLVNRHACPECLAVFKKCWKKYEQTCKSQK